MVVSVNPYRPVDIFNPSYVQQYKDREIYERPPHIFALADNAHKTMRRQAKDTCIVISGKIFFCSAPEIHRLLELLCLFMSFEFE